MTNVTDERAQKTSASEQVNERVQDAAQKAKGETRQHLRSQVNARSTQAGEQARSIAEAMRRPPNSSAARETTMRPK